MVSVRPLSAGDYQFTLQTADELPIDANNFSRIIFKIGNIIKTWLPDGSGTAEYIGDGNFSVYLSQQETNSFYAPPKCQAMLYQAGDLVSQSNIPTLNLLPTTFRDKKDLTSC